MIKKVVFNKVHIIHNLFSGEELLTIRSALGQVNWEKDINDNYCAAIGFLEGSKYSYVIDIYESKVAQLKREIEKDFCCNIGDENHSSVVSYRSGWSLHSHVDYEPGLKTFSGYPSRDISSLMYLTDDFTGGKLVFNNLDIEIEPVAGSAIYFPSNEEHIHEVTELISGNRWVSTCFWHILQTR